VLRQVLWIRTLLTRGQGLAGLPPPTLPWGKIVREGVASGDFTCRATAWTQTKEIPDTHAHVSMGAWFNKRWFQVTGSDPKGGRRLTRGCVAGGSPGGGSMQRISRTGGQWRQRACY
jgi:hypothetical protein